MKAWARFTYSYMYFAYKGPSVFLPTQHQRKTISHLGVRQVYAHSGMDYVGVFLMVIYILIKIL